MAVILTNYLNQTSQPFTQAQAASLMTTVNQFYQEKSYHQFSVTADIYGYLNLPVNETCDGGLRREFFERFRNALARHDVQPTAEQMQLIFDFLKEYGTPWILEATYASSLFEARSFAEMVVMARRLAEVCVPGLADS